MCRTPVGRQQERTSEQMLRAELGVTVPTAAALPPRSASCRSHHTGRQRCSQPFIPTFQQRLQSGRCCPGSAAAELVRVKHREAGPVPPGDITEGQSELPHHSRALTGRSFCLSQLASSIWDTRINTHRSPTFLIHIFCSLFAFKTKTYSH